MSGLGSENWNWIGLEVGGWNWLQERHRDEVRERARG